MRAVRPGSRNADPRGSYTGPADEFLSRRSQLYLRLRSRHLNWRLGDVSEGHRPETILHAAYSPQGPEQYRVTVAGFVELARTVGARPVLMTQARLPTPGNEATVGKRVSYRLTGLTHAALVRAFAEIDAIIREIAAAKGVAVIDAAARMSGETRYFTDHVHFTEAGSRRTAEITAETLRRLIEGN